MDIKTDRQDIHICFGQIARNLLIKSNEFDPSGNKIVCLEDHLCDGPLCDIHSNKETEKRKEWISSICSNDEFTKIFTDYVTKDLDTIQKLVAEAENCSRIFFWTGFNASEMISTARLLYHIPNPGKEMYMADFPHIPVMALSGEIIYPDILAVTNATDVKEITRHFKKIDSHSFTRWKDLWKKFMGGDSLLRVLEENGDISAHDETYFDSFLISNCTDQFQSAARIIGSTLVDIDFGVGDIFLNWRLKQLAGTGKIAFRGALKEIRDYQVMLLNYPQKNDQS
ncbi:DUF3658 domain-containing protein [Proteiniphilum sp.]|uniref:DUF3658 domain-containing protein n=1 Tax=Proteiniphilum sp. TaxID=1926877 RepID=UPI00332610DC